MSGLRFHRGACPGLPLIHTTQGGWPRTRETREEFRKPRPPVSTLALTVGRELGALPRHPSSAQAWSQQRKGSSDVAWGIVQSGGFVVWCFIFWLMFSF